jgi:hypothetical protein
MCQEGGESGKKGKNKWKSAKQNRGKKWGEKDKEQFHFSYSPHFKGNQLQIQRIEVVRLEISMASRMKQFNDHALETELL